MKKNLIELSLCLLFVHFGHGQSPSFKTYMNPVIPGDHPDCTVTKIGKDFYTTGSSFNPTPVIYHSTDLVHWEAIAQPVSTTWSNYGDAPAGGCWGGQVVYYNNKYWHFFSRSNQMYFTTAKDIKGTWTLPTLMSSPFGVPGLGYDNSIFIDDDGKCYLLVKNGQVNNWSVQLGDNGQPSGAVYNLCWINPSPLYPYSWAEGPVMWKHKGCYYYSFARNVAGGQKVFKSRTLTDSSSSWIVLGDFFNESDPLKGQALFQNPNHSSVAVMLDDSTSWVIHPLWRNYNNEWYGQGRQGLLNQVRYDTSGKPTTDYPINVSKDAPTLPSSGIPWMVPHSDFFSSNKLNPEWSFLGYTPASYYSLSTRSGWLTLSPKQSGPNTVIKNDGEHNYSIITKVDFAAQSVNDQAGIWIFNGLQTLYAKLYCSIDSSGNKIVAFSYQTMYYIVNNPAASGENTILLKLVRVNHLLTGYFSFDGMSWTQVGSSISVTNMDNLQPNYNSWTGNRQGLFVAGSQSAAFDYYIYRDAYTPILAECPANQYGTTPSSRGYRLNEIHNNDWALYAGVEFGNTEYKKNPDSLTVTASCASSGGVIEVWIDSIDTGTKIAECAISNTGGETTFTDFKTNILKPVSGTHDVYLKFTGTSSDKLFNLEWLTFIDGSKKGTSVDEFGSELLPKRYELYQNYPNPFNPRTQINYSILQKDYISLKVYNLLGQEVVTLFESIQQAGNYVITFDGSRLAGGIYFYKLMASDFETTKKFILIK